MKSTILIAVGLVATPLVTAVLKSPELIPIAAWQKLPLPCGELSSQDVAEMNRKYGSGDISRPGPSTATARKAEWSQTSNFELGVDAGARNPATPAPTARLAQPLLLAQADDPGGDADPTTPTTPTPPAAPEPPSTPLAPLAHGLEVAVDELQHEVAEAQQQAEKAANEAKGAFDRATSAFSTGDYGQFARLGGSSTHNLIIRSSDTDPKSLVAADQDLSVMGRILAKAAAKTGEDEEKTALGIHISSFGSGVRNIQIEGHGVIFLLKANFPLVGAPEKVVEEKPKEPGNSTWESTRDELYGSHESTAETRHLGHSKEPKIKYDSDRVEQLENTLLDAMKNAANIRSLKDGETVTVVVTSGDDGSNLWEMDTGPFGYNSSGNTYVWSSSSSSYSSGSVRKSHGGTLTIRAKKSDIDAFFHGKSTIDDFRRKATIATY
ncbi:MAG TPA: hypothetical protein VN281_18395 [Verrucomicrobiae bacterium]|jgi:hypothetical protein|nr:hypothetical protein [Verrucomicrobiae bacterium]